LSFFHHFESGMKKKLVLDILPQPDDTTCGPTSLHAVYRYFGDVLPLDRVISEVRPLEDGGTLAVYLANHALDRGYRATIYTYNLQIFDPTWFGRGDRPLREKLLLQARQSGQDRVRDASRAYLDFLQKGGRIRFEDGTAQIIRRTLNRSIPILTGLLSTYLYQCARETAEGSRLVSDDVRGEPTGHFVVLTGYDKKLKKVQIADPLRQNPYSSEQEYEVDLQRLIGAILLGILTYDANLLVIEPQ
jgi:hypothetical protein